MSDQTKRTDLADELYELSQPVEGIERSRRRLHGLDVTSVAVNTADAAERLGKPRGRYVTIDISPLAEHEEGSFENSVAAICAELRALLPDCGGKPVLVVGLGNRAVTPDAVGPLAADKVLATRHLLENLPDQFGMLRPVTVITPGVLGTTGIETGEIVSGILRKVPHAAVIALDALAARREMRLCRTVQLADTGVSPGSGVGNTRFPLDSETLGVPCIALGVPTVVDTATLTADVLDEEGISYDYDSLREKHNGMFVTPKDIDVLSAQCARAIGYGINTALQPELSLADIDLFLS